jgi:hypothetical protein
LMIASPRATRSPPDHPQPRSFAMIRTSLRLVAPLALCLSAACGGAHEPAPGAVGPTAEPAAEPAAAEPAAAEPSEAYGVCVELLTRQADCTDVFIPGAGCCPCRSRRPRGDRGSRRREGPRRHDRH